MKELTISDLQDQFNESLQTVRVLSMLSPTCKECLCGYGSVREIFDGIDSERLKGFLVWLPMLSGDNFSSADWQQKAWIDRRVVHGWDFNRKIGDLFARTLLLRNTAAWDVYLIYEKGTKWDVTGKPPKPTFWMHQLSADSGADPRSCLKAVELFQKVQNLLEEN